MSWLRLQYEKRGARLALITLLYLALLGFAPLYTYFTERLASPEIAWVQLGVDILFAYIYAYVLICVLTVRGWLASLCLPVLFACSALANDFILHFHINLTPDILGTVWEATTEEIISYLHLSLFLYIAIALLLAVFSLRMLKKSPPLPVHTRMAFMCSVFVLGVLLGDDGGTGQQYVPFNILHSAYHYAKDHWHRPERADISLRKFSWQAPANGLIVVMVIGESARADHFSLNGYKRKTNPLLEKETNVVSFHDATSCTALTRTAVPCMLTRKTLAEAANENLNITIPETSVISVFKKLKFDTLWVGVQGTHAFTDSPFLALMEEAHRYVLLNPYLFLRGKLDEEAFPYMDGFLAGPNPTKFLVVHTFGSHWPYTNRYPQTFKRYAPVCKESSAWSNFFALATAMKECDRQPNALVNAYDNSIVYTDYFLDELIQRLKNKNALVLYASDHGQSLGENGLYLHGNMQVKEQRHIAMLAWASDDFIHQHPRAWWHVKEHVDVPVSHDYIFHSLLNCAGIRSDVIHTNLSLCEPYAPHAAAH